MTFEFTREQLLLLAHCSERADIWNHQDATFLRELHETRCGIVRIHKIKTARYNTYERQPHLNCSLTEKGKKVVTTLALGGCCSLPRSRRWSRPGDDERDIYSRKEVSR